MERKPKDIFQTGPISSEKIAASIQNHSSKTGIGAHSIFLGQVRADDKDASRVRAIEYTAYEEMALEKAHEIREEIFQKYALSCMHIHHSLGEVKAGEICLLVFTSTKHRKAAMEACEELVERVKNELPIWGKELLESEQEHWKVNS